MKHFHTLIGVLIAAVFVASCKKDNPIPTRNVSIEVTLPSGIDAKDGVEITLTDVNSGLEQKVTTDASGAISLKLEQSVFNIMASATKTLTTVAANDSVFTKEVQLKGLLENFTISDTTTTIPIKLFVVIESNGWVFKELYFCGSKTPEGKSYRQDKYFEIYNNSDEVLYADGIALAEVDHLTVSFGNQWEYLINEAVVVDVIYGIPGNGTDYPVNAGESIILCDVGIDHREANVNSFDLSFGC